MKLSEVNYKIKKISEIEIEKLHKIIEKNGEEIETSKNSVVKPKLNILAKSMNKNFEIEYKLIKYIMKHKTNKEMFEVKGESNSVIITEDHSIMTRKNGELKEALPKDEIREIFENNHWTNNFELKSKGKYKEYVYDIEVEDNHNFFANNILVHNSSYITFEKLGNKLLEKYGVKSFFDLDLEERKEFTEKLLDFIETKIQPIIDESVNYIQSKLNAYQRGFVGAKVEKVNLKGFWTAKKRYALLTIWNEGKFLIEKPKISVTGLEVVKSSTPDFSIDALEKAIEIILKGTEKELQNYIKEVKKDFLKVAEENPQAIGEVTKINNLDYLLDDKGYYRINENGQRIGAPMNSKAGIAYNQLLKEKGLEEYFMPIEPGMKAYLIKLKPSNPYKFDAIAFLDDDFLKDTDLIKYIDTDYMWEKTFISPLKFIAESINYQLERKASTVDDWF